MTIASRDINNSRQFDWHLWSDSPCIVEIINNIQSSASKSLTAKQSENLGVLVANLVAVASIDSTRSIAYSRNRSTYTRPKRYNEQGIGYDPLTCIVDQVLIPNDWVTQKIGSRTHVKKDRKNTRLWPTEKFLTLLKSTGSTSGDVVHHPKEELIILRDHKEADEKKGKDIDYADDLFTCSARTRLRAYNDMLGRHSIEPPTLLSSPIDPLYTYVRRIFANNSFELGGRFYGGWWQGLNLEERNNITLDGSTVVEHDFSGLHLYLAYREIEVIYRDDPYELDGVPKVLRPIIKTALLVLFNCKNQNGVVHAIRKDIKDSLCNPSNLPHKVSNRFSKIENLTPYLSGTPLPNIVEKLIEKHSPVSSMFFTGHGTKLQRLDSDLADYVITKFTELDKPILGVHDSFIVKKEDDELLKKTMEDGCKNVLHFEPCEIHEILCFLSEKLNLPRNITY